MNSFVPCPSNKTRFATHEVSSPWFLALRRLKAGLAIATYAMAGLMAAPAFGGATGGTVTTSGAYTIHTFTGTGTFTVNSALTADVVIVAGGGGGGHQHAGGGGAGGVQALNAIAISPGTYTITVGAGGGGGVTYPYTGTNGDNSSALGYTSIGGGAGTGMSQYGNDGGSGGADGYPSGGVQGGNATSGQGNLGSRGGSLSQYNGGGGGGAGGAGWGLAGGAPVANWAGTFAGGGGGGFGGGIGGGAGAGNGGNGGSNGDSALANTGSGGGGGGNMDASGGNGGSGIVVIRYLTQGGAATPQAVSIKSISSKTVTQTVALLGGGLDQPYYQATYADLAAAFGVHLWDYWNHFQEWGFLEGRSPYAGSNNEGSAYAQSGLPVAFSVTSGPGVITGNTLSFSGGGTVVLRASQYGGTTPANGATFSAAYAETSIVVVNQNPTNTTSILNSAKAVLASNPTSSVDIAFGDTFYIRVAGSDPDGRLATLYSRLNLVGGAAGWDYPAVGVSGGSASYDFGPYNTANGGGIGVANVWTHVQDANSGPYQWQGDGWWGSEQPDVNIVKATPNGTFANRSYVGTYTVTASDLSANWSNPYSGSVAAPTGSTTYAVVGSSGSGSVPVPNAVNVGTVFYPGTYTLRATYSGDGNYNGTTKDATFTIGDRDPMVTSTVVSASTIVFGQSVTVTSTAWDPDGNLSFHGMLTLSQDGSNWYRGNMCDHTTGWGNGHPTTSAITSASYTSGAVSGSSDTEWIVHQPQWTGIITYHSNAQDTTGRWASSDSNNWAASDGYETVAVSAAPPSGTFSNASKAPQSGAIFTVGASDLNASFANPFSGSVAAPSGAISYAIAPTSPNGVPGTPIMVGSALSAGLTYVIRATIAADGNYFSAFCDSIWTISKGIQPAVAVTSASSVVYGNGYTATASGGSGTGALVWTLVSGGTAPGAAINASTGAVTASAPGTVYFNVYKSGDTNFNQSATTANFSLTINKATQPTPVTITSSNTATFGGAAYTATASGGDAGAYVWSLGAGSTAPGAAINSSTGAVTTTNTGTVIFNVYRTGDAIYLPTAPTGNFTLNVNSKQAQAALTLTSASSFNFGQPYTATTGGGSTTGAVTYALSVGSTALGAAISSGGAVTSTGVGTVVIVATKAGDDTYNPRSDTFTVTVNKIAQPTVLSLSSSNGTYGAAYTAVGGGGDAGAYSYAVAGGTALGQIINASTGVLTTTSSGTVIIAVTRAGDAIYNPVTSNFTVTLGQRPITVTLAGSKNYDTTNASTGATASVTSGTLAGTDTINYIYAAASSAVVGSYTGLATATISNGSAPTNRTSSYAISYVGTYAINQAAQPPPTLGGSATITYGGTTALTPAGGSGTGAYIYAITGAPAGNIAGDVYIPAGSGTATITVRRAADTNYLVSAASTGVIVTVNPKSLAVTGLSFASKGYDGTTTATATGTPTLVGIINSDVVTLSGTPNYTFASANVATGIVVSTTGYTLSGAHAGKYSLIQPSGIANIARASQATLVLSSPTAIIFGTPYTATVSGGSSSGTISWALGVGSTAAGAAIDPVTGVVGFTGAGSVVFHATKAGDGNYNAITSTDFTLTINNASQTAEVKVTSAAKAGLGETYVATAKGGDGTGAYLWTLVGGTAPGAAIDSGTGVVTFTGNGTVIFNVRRAGDAIYSPSTSSGNFTLTIMAAQTITFPAMLDDNVGQWHTWAHATSSSSLPIEYTFDNPSVVSGIVLDTDGSGIVTMIGAGQVKITASQPGNGTYAPAPPVSQMLRVAPPGSKAGNANGYVTLVTLTSTGNGAPGNFTCKVQRGDGVSVLSSTVHTSTKTAGVRNDAVVTYTGDTNGTSVSAVTVQYVDQVWGASEVISSTCGGLTTTYNYYSDPAFKGNYRRLKSVTEPTGNWVAYQYYDDWDRRGQTQYEFHPFLDSPATVSFAPAQGRVISFNYQASWNGRYTRPLNREEKVNDTRVAYSSYVASDVAGGNNYWPVEVIAVTASRTDALSQTSANANYRSDAGLVAPGRPYYSIGADGTKTCFNEMSGDYNWDTHTLSALGGGNNFRTLAVHGSTNNNDGTATLIDYFDSANLPGTQQFDFIWMTPYKSTVDVCLYDNAYHLLLNETYIYTGDHNFSLATWTKYTYDNRGRVRTSTANNGTTTSYRYANGLLTDSTDAAGVVMGFTYDILGRTVSSTRQGKAGTPQPYDITAISTYDGLGRTVKTVVGGTLASITEYDSAGRIKSNTVPGGVAGYKTSYSYSANARVVTAEGPSYATEVKEVYLDGSPKSVSGSGVIAENHLWTVVPTAGATRMKHEVWHAGVTANKVTTYSDMLGSIVEVRSPGTAGGADIIATNTYDGKGHVVRSTQTGAPDMLYKFDVLGRQVMQGADLNKNGELDLTSAGDDRIAAQDAYFAPEGSAWTAVTTKSVYAKDNTTPKIVGKTVTQLTNFPITPLTVSKTTVTDIYLNQAVSVTTLDPATTTFTTTTTSTDATLPVSSISVYGMAQSSTDKAGVTLTFGYDTHGRQTTVTDSQGRTVTTAYLPNSSEVSSVTDAAGIVQQAYVYDNVGRVVEVQVPNPNKGVNGDTRATLSSHYGYDALGQKVHEWGENALPVEYVYDAMGRQTQMKTFAALPITDFNGSVWPTPAPVATATTTWNYEASTGLLLSKVDAANHSVVFTYTPENKLLTKKNARGQTTTYDYSPTTGELTGESYAGLATPLAYTYDRMGNIETVKDDAGTRTFTYNITDTLELNQQDFAANGSLADFAGQCITYGIDSTVGAKGRVKKIAFGTSDTSNLNQEITYGYQATDGRLSTISDGTILYTYAYQPNSHLIASGTLVGGANTYTDSRAYEAMHDWSKGRQTSFGAAATPTIISSFNHTLDSVGRITATAKTGALFKPYAAAMNGGLNTAYAYSDRDELVGESTTSTAGISALSMGRDNGSDSSRGYVYDNMGNRKVARHNAIDAADATHTTTYTTNNLNQYTGAATPGYYDVAGYTDANNTVTVSRASGTAGTAGTTTRSNEYFFNPYGLDNSTSAAWSTLTVTDGLTVANPTAYLAPRPFVIQYDDDGNMTDDGHWRYTYNIKNQLISIETSETAKSVITTDVNLAKYCFTYDYLGRRIKKQTYGTTDHGATWTESLSAQQRYLYNGWNLAVVLKSDKTKAKGYVWGLDLSGSSQGAGGVGGLLMVQDAGNIYLPAYDTNGNVHALVTLNSATINSIVYPAGSMVASYEYDAFGKTLREDGPYAESNPFRFSTKFTDVETDLVYYGLRYYSPAFGRFINQDPIEEDGGLNLYGFCGNNGVDGFDVLGMTVFTTNLNNIIADIYGTGYTAKSGMNLGVPSWYVVGSVSASGGTFKLNLKSGLYTLGVTAGTDQSIIDMIGYDPDGYYIHRGFAFTKTQWALASSQIRAMVDVFYNGLPSVVTSSPWGGGTNPANPSTPANPTNPSTPTDTTPPTPNGTASGNPVSTAQNTFSSNVAGGGGGAPNGVDGFYARRGADGIVEIGHAGFEQSVHAGFRAAAPIVYNIQMLLNPAGMVSQRVFSEVMSKQQFIDPQLLAALPILGTEIRMLTTSFAAESSVFNAADFADDVARIRAESLARYGLGEGITAMANLSPSAQRVLGNLSNMADQTVAAAIRTRGGTAANVARLETGMGQRILGEVAEAAARGDAAAVQAIKMVKQAAKKGQRY